MFCWRLCNDQQHLTRSVAPDLSSSSRRAVVGVVPVEVVVVDVIAATTMTCTKQHLSQILLDNMRCAGLRSLGDDVSINLRLAELLKS